MSCPRGCCIDYRTHINGISIGSLPTPTTLTERKWDKDMAAFKRLSDEGLNPGKLDGAYVMERSAKHPREIEMGRPFDSATHRAFDEHGA